MAVTPFAEDALSRLFLQGWKARRKIDACKLASGSPERAVRERTYRLHASFTSHSFLCLRLCVYFIYGLIQKCLAEGVAALERTTELANEMSLFSDNKDLVELVTASHK